MLKKLRLLKDFIFSENYILQIKCYDRESNLSETKYLNLNSDKKIMGSRVSWKSWLDHVDKTSFEGEMFIWHDVIWIRNEGVKFGFAEYIDLYLTPNNTFNIEPFLVHGILHTCVVKTYARTKSSKADFVFLAIVPLDYYQDHFYHCMENPTMFDHLNSFSGFTTSESSICLVDVENMILPILKDIGERPR